MPDISFQLYSARDAGPLRDTLRRLAGLGYARVEGYGGILDKAEALARDLDAYGFSMPTCHMSLDDIESDPKARIAEARLLGIKTVFAPHIAAESRPRNLAGWEKFARRLVEAGKPFRDAGLGFGWHNHEFELVDLGGTTPLDIIANTDVLALELDIGWLIRAGADPIRFIEDYGDRIIAAHIKDVAPDGEALDEDGWADVGHGRVEWPPIHAALDRTGALYVVEHDKPSDAFRFAERSFRTVSSF